MRRDTEQAFAKISSEILKATSKAKSAASKYLDKDAVASLQDALREQILYAAWTAANESFSRQYIDYVPGVENAPDRDATGRRKTPRKVAKATEALRAPTPDETRPAPEVRQTYVSGGPDPRFDADAVMAEREKEEANRRKYGSWFVPRR